MRNPFEKNANDVVSSVANVAFVVGIVGVLSALVAYSAYRIAKEPVSSLAQRVHTGFLSAINLNSNN